MKRKLVSEEERQDVRKRIKRDAHNLCELIVKTNEEYKEELFKLELDNIQLKTNNKLIQSKCDNLKQQNELLQEEIKRKDISSIILEKTISKLLYKVAHKYTCGSCLHEIGCEYSADLCGYCQKWICQCCRLWCKFSHYSDGKTKKCYNSICKTCVELFGNNCPKHNENIDKEKRDKLDKYHKENHYEYPWKDEESESE